VSCVVLVKIDVELLARGNLTFRAKADPQNDLTPQRHRPIGSRSRPQPPTTAFRPL
jgi:hypothetical protein